MSLASVLLLGRSSWFRPGGSVSPTPPTKRPQCAPPPPPPPPGVFVSSVRPPPPPGVERERLNQRRREWVVSHGLSSYVNLDSPPEFWHDSNGVRLFRSDDPPIIAGEFVPDTVPRFTCAHCRSYRESHLGSCEGCGSREVEEGSGR